MTARPPTAIAALTVDCADAGTMVEFYRRAFGGEADPDFPDLDCVRVDGLLILFRQLEGWTPPTWPGPQIQMHLEIHVDDLERAEARLVGLGARRPAAQDLADRGLVVLVDPAGHPFCLSEGPRT